MKKMAYFIVGNLWLFIALVLLLGRNVARTQPTMYSFFGIGGWYYPAPYGFMVVVCVVLGVFLMMVGMSRRE